jgi:hypothetical protein
MKLLKSGMPHLPCFWTSFIAFKNFVFDFSPSLLDGVESKDGLVYDVGL